MCFFGGDEGGSASVGPPAAMPRVDVETELPQSQQIIEEGKQADVEYGSSKKESGQAAANRAGADSLRIGLNTGSQGGGGVNTGRNNNNNAGGQF